MTEKEIYSEIKKGIDTREIVAKIDNHGGAKCLFCFT